MEAIVVDASVAIKWVYSEELSAQAHSVRVGRRLVAPELIFAECANILWKKVRKFELEPELAILSVAALRRSGIEPVPIPGLSAGALRMAIELDHPAYDCFYLELCRLRELTMVTADDRLLRKLAQTRFSAAPLPIALSEFRR